MNYSNASTDLEEFMTLSYEMEEGYGTGFNPVYRSGYGFAQGDGNGYKFGYEYGEEDTGDEDYGDDEFGFGDGYGYGDTGGEGYTSGAPLWPQQLGWVKYEWGEDI